jgi:hypothetical protein
VLAPCVLVLEMVAMWAATLLAVYTYVARGSGRRAVRGEGGAAAPPTAVPPGPDGAGAAAPSPTSSGQEAPSEPQTAGGGGPASRRRANVDVDTFVCPITQVS